MQLKNSGPAVVNWLRIHRSATWSYIATGSPDSSVQSFTAKPAHSEPSDAETSLVPVLV